jgi:hypothetical protein
MLTSDVSVSDHRAVGGLLPGDGLEAAIALAHSALDVTSELRFEVEEVIATTAAAVAVRGTWVGRAADGNGEVLLSMALVLGVGDGLVSSIEVYEPDAEAPRARAAGFPRMRYRCLPRTLGGSATDLVPHPLGVAAAGSDCRDSERLSDLFGA